MYLLLIPVFVILLLKTIPKVYSCNAVQTFRKKWRRQLKQQQQCAKFLSSSQVKPSQNAIKTETIYPDGSLGRIGATVGIYTLANLADRSPTLALLSRRHICKRRAHLHDRHQRCQKLHSPKVCKKIQLLFLHLGTFFPMSNPPTNSRRQ